MAVVVNDVVKMEWEQSRFLQTKSGGKNKKPVFILACKDYPSDSPEALNGVVPVFFNTSSAWLHIDDEGLFPYSEIKNFLKGGIDYTFPECYGEYNPILTLGSDNVDMDLVKRFGLEEYVDDIKARLEDLSPYGDEKDFGAE